MFPVNDIRGEHSAMKIILNAMKRLVYDFRGSVSTPEISRISQIADFLSIFTIHCHYEKEEKGLFNALIELDIPNVTKTINHLIAEHTIARGYIQELVVMTDDFIKGRYVPFLSISTNLSNFVTLEEQHMRTEDAIVLPMSDKLLGTRELLEISSAYKLIQDEQVGHAKHVEYYNLLNKLYAEND
jgi:hemerythrin-like domain-containing protein